MGTEASPVVMLVREHFAAVAVYGSGGREEVRWSVSGGEVEEVWWWCLFVVLVAASGQVSERTIKRKRRR